MSFRLLFLLTIISITQLCFCIASLEDINDSTSTETPTGPTPTLLAEVTNRFRVDDVTGAFLLNGKPIVLFGANMQYYRIPRPYWRQRLRSLRSAGLNTVHVAIEWSTHEPSPGVFKFTGDEDFVLFIRLAQEEGLLVAVRPGPFVDDERDFGGYPAWLLWDKQHAELRGNDVADKKSVKRYMGEMLTRLKPLLVEHGGPVILVEIEKDGDEHFEWLVNLLKRRLGPGVAMLTHGDRMARMYARSADESYLRSLNYRMFDVAKDTRPLTHSVRQVTANGGQIADYSISWSTLWGYYVREEMSTEGVRQVFQDAVETNTSICLSSFTDGTDFGFKSGAWIQPLTQEYSPQTTSFNVAAPLDEAGVETDKYYAIADALNSTLVPPPHGTPTNNTLSLGPIFLRPVASLLDNATITALSTRTVHDKLPQSFESMHQASGFVLYETVIGRYYGEPVLRMPELKDRAQIYINQKLHGTLSRASHEFTMYLPNVKAGSRLQIFVENQGRTYWNPSDDSILYKGLAYGGDVRFDRDTLYGWSSHGFPLDDVAKLQSYADRVENDTGHVVLSTPTLYAGNFVLPADTSNPIPDTFLHLHTTWTKGVIFINGHNLGRYWPRVGPQTTLYLPGCFLLAAPQPNRLLILELEHVTVSEQQVTLVKSHKMYQLGRRRDVLVPFAMVVLMTSLMLMFTYGTKWADWMMRRY